MAGRTKPVDAKLLDLAKGMKQGRIDKDEIEKVASKNGVSPFDLEVAWKLNRYRDYMRRYMRSYRGYVMDRGDKKGQPS